MIFLSFLMFSLKFMNLKLDNLHYLPYNERAMSQLYNETKFSGLG